MRKLDAKIEIEDRWLVRVDNDLAFRPTRTVLTNQQYFQGNGEIVRLRDVNSEGGTCFVVTIKTPHGTASKEEEYFTYDDTEAWEWLQERLDQEHPQAICSISKIRHVYDWCDLTVDALHVAPGFFIVEFEHNDLHDHGFKSEPASFIRTMLGDRALAVNITGFDDFSNFQLAQNKKVFSKFNSAFSTESLAGMVLRRHDMAMNQQPVPALVPGESPIETLNRTIVAPDLVKHTVALRMSEQM